MKRYRLVYRGSRNTYCYFDTHTNKRESLGTDNREEAERLIEAKNEAVRHSEMNLQIAQVYLQHSDPTLATRTWQDVMEKVTSLKTGPTQERWQYAVKDKAFDLIRNRKLVETNAEHFLSVLKSGSVATNVYLRRAHNFAIGMHWLPWPVLPKLQWPPVHFKAKQAITLAEHQMIIQRERNPELRAFYELLWHLGASQTDAATLNAEDVNWIDRTVSFKRRKTKVPVVITFGADAAAVLDGLPKSGPLFPWLSRLHERHRAKHFIKRLASLNIKGVSLHSYPRPLLKGFCPCLLQKCNGRYSLSGILGTENCEDAQSGSGLKNLPGLAPARSRARGFEWTL